ncbi:MAG TPA: glycosyltransferase family 4 protein [Longimicrobiales bacterium]
MHRTPTPRGGGVAIAAAWMVALPVLWALGEIDGSATLGLCVGGGAVAAIGWWDDHRGLPAWVRLAVHAAAAAWTIAHLGDFSAMHVGDGVIRLGPAGAILAGIALVWMINLYNFMDGIDGLAGGECVTAALAAACILHARGAAGLGWLAFVLAAAGAGFLVWNWPPAKIFMGDVGSGFLGYAFGALALTAESKAGIPALALLIPLMVFVVDATFTLFRRLVAGERITQAHRSHVYQRLVRRGWTHRRVTGLVLVVNGGLAALAWDAAVNPARLPVAVLASTAAVSAVGTLALRLTPERTRSRESEDAATTAPGGR